ncbi:hypothetical protein F7734_52855 [Scytonema sp. UIC 10036]|uniref:hypothetical protein n=1 Tax=Scytonema sp. UIC 10036 TaxID=2304196 RepID=UPI0012DAC557|nr:hypothetical protein [Scytonema sp. UIC 10036]MUH00506.1 hypothetical protein [Scytonema sp. UIC 10036]
MNTNGKSNVISTEQLEMISSENIAPESSEIKPKKQRKTPTNLNKVEDVRLDLDAGSARAKFVVDGWCGNYPTMFKEVVGELPSGISGCFSIGTKNYAVGQVANSLNGNLVEAFKDNKIKFLHIWLIGALSTHPDLLADIANRRKYKGKPARLKITLRLLSLSSSKRNDISKILGELKSFTCEGCEFQLEVTNSDYLFPEGYGSALEAVKKVADGTREFNVLDLGGGTLTFSTYQVGKRPKAVEQTSGSGNGMKAVIERLSIALARVDRGGVQYRKESLESALRNSKPLGDGKHSVKYRHGQESLEIGDTVAHALSEWVAESPIVETLLAKVSQALLNGTPVFACGGGFAISAVAGWIEKYVTRDIEAPQFTILPSPQDINLTGLKYLDSSSHN